MEKIFKFKSINEYLYLKMYLMMNLMMYLNFIYKKKLMHFKEFYYNSPEIIFSRTPPEIFRRCRRILMKRTLPPMDGLT